MRKVGLLGGSFDPVHNGHLHIAHHAQRVLDLDEVRFIPCHHPSHKVGLCASGQHRKAMLELAVVNHSRYVVDSCELVRDQTSYTLNTLQLLRDSLGYDTVFVFILGWDSWVTLDEWHSWQRLFTLTNFAVLRRSTNDALMTEPGGTAVVDLADEDKAAFVEITQSKAVAPEALCKKPYGSYAILDAPEFDVSSSQIRKMSREAIEVSNYLPESVFNYIIEHKLYI